MASDGRFKHAVRRVKVVATWARFVGLIGLLLLVAAAIDLTFGNGGTQTTALVFAGVLLLIFPLVADGLAAVQLGPGGFRLEISRQFAEAGARGTARIVDRWASDLAVTAEVYGRVRSTADGGETHAERAVRVRTQDGLVDEAVASARLYKYDRDELIAGFHKGSPVMRVLIVGLMLGDTSLADDGVVTSAISDSRSANEQYHALRLAVLQKPRMSESRIACLTTVILEDNYIWSALDRAREAAKFVGSEAAGSATQRVSQLKAANTGRD
jgi:hypothetical protein